MKTRILIIILILTGSFVLAQTPEAFKYQAIIGNASGDILANTTVALKISVLRDSQTGAVVYEETFHPTTNDHGLVDVEIGNGSFYSIDWGDTDYFLKVEVDPANGSSFTHLGTSPLLSVPYALYARTAELDEVDDADADPSNELQSLSIVGNDLSISSGNSVALPTGADDWGSQVVASDATLSGDGTSGSPLGVVGDLTDNQTLSLVGNDLSISDGNSVALPTGADDWGSQVVESDATLSGVGTSGSPLGVVGDLTDNQTLSLVGNDLSISDGNSVTLPAGADDWGSQVVASDATLSGVGTGGDPLHVLGDLTDNQTLNFSEGNLSISGGNSIPIPSSPWLMNGANIYYNAGNVGIGVSSPEQLLHVRGITRFDGIGGSISISTPGSWPGFIAFDQTSDHRRDIVFRQEGISLTASTSNSAPGNMDGVWIIEGGNVGIATWLPGDYPLKVNERSIWGLAINDNATGEAWELYVSSSGDLELYRGSGVYRGGFDAATGVYSPISDRRFKKDIKPLNITLNNVKHIKPSTYTMRSDTEGKTEIGLIAQELREYFPELVNDVLDKKNDEIVYTINYNGVAVVAVKAIQEQQEIIEQQAKTIQEQSDRIDELERKFELLQKRMRQF